MTVLIAETAAVQAAYPTAPASAVEHLLWALHRAVPLLESGQTEQGIAGLRADLASYGGDIDDLRALGVERIFAAAGRIECAGILGDLRLLRAEKPPAGYVVIGDELAAVIWGRTRGIGRHQIIAVRGARTEKLLGLTGDGLVIVELSGDPLPQALADRLQLLVAGGAIVRDGTWRPGDRPDPDAGRPRLDVHRSAARPH